MTAVSNHIGSSNGYDFTNDSQLNGLVKNWLEWDEVSY